MDTQLPADFPVQSILDFWFGQSISDAEALKAQSRRWFNGGPALDHEIGQRFGEWPLALATVSAEAFDQPQVLLAAVLVLDQFPRHLYRGEAKAFAFDDKALQLLDAALDRDWDKQLHPLQTSFLYMPLQHAENLDRQRQAVELYGALSEQAPAGYREFIESNLAFARQHLDIVQRFGRFPHRNEALRRTSTREEVAYLNDKPNRFGQ